MNVLLQTIAAEAGTLVDLNEKIQEVCKKTIDDNPEMILQLPLPPPSIAISKGVFYGILTMTFVGNDEPAKDATKSPSFPFEFLLSLEDTVHTWDAFSTDAIPGDLRTVFQTLLFDLSETDHEKYVAFRSANRRKRK